MAIELEDVKIDVMSDLDMADSKHDISFQSMNSVIRVEDDAQSSLDTSVISVIKVSDAEDKESELVKGGSVLDGAEEQDSVVELGKEAVDENLTLSMA